MYIGECCKEEREKKIFRQVEINFKVSLFVAEWPKASDFQSTCRGFNHPNNASYITHIIICETLLGFYEGSKKACLLITVVPILFLRVYRRKNYSMLDVKKSTAMLFSP